MGCSLLQTNDFRMASFNQRSRTNRVGIVNFFKTIAQSLLGRTQRLQGVLVAFNVFKVLIVVAVLMPKVMTDNPGNSWRIT